MPVGRQTLTVTIYVEDFNQLAEIISGAKKDWGRPLDEFFIRAFESHHEALLGEISGADIALFAAHLATLNLDENYPRIRRGNFTVRLWRRSSKSARLPFAPAANANS
jgi:hypothetical protein